MVRAKCHIPPPDPRIDFFAANNRGWTLSWPEWKTLYEYDGKVPSILEWIWTTVVRNGVEYQEYRRLEHIKAEAEGRCHWYNQQPYHYCNVV